MVSIPWRSIKKVFFFPSHFIFAKMPEAAFQLCAFNEFSKGLLSLEEWAGNPGQPRFGNFWETQSRLPWTGSETHSFQLENPWSQSQPQKRTGGRQGAQSFKEPLVGKAFPISVLIGMQVLGHSVVSCQHQEALRYRPSLQSASCVLPWEFCS